LLNEAHKHYNTNESTCNGRLSTSRRLAAYSYTQHSRAHTIAQPLPPCAHPHRRILTRLSQTPRPASKMRGGNTRQRPVSQHDAQPYMQTSVAPTRKIFNCIVDDTALVAGVKRSTRNGIRQWVKNGQIRLFVPLHGTCEHNEC